MTKEKIVAYLTRRAENWVSTFVLVGCVAIAASLFYVSTQAGLVGENLSLVQLSL